MLQIEDLKQELQAQQPKIEYLKEALGYENLLKEKRELDEQAAKPDFWNDVENTKQVLKQQKLVNEKIGSYDELVTMYEDAQTMLSLQKKRNLQTKRNRKLFCRISKRISGISWIRIEEEKLSALLSGEFDANNAILTFHAGAGGTEAQDWVQMLYRMYARWSERHHFKVKVLDYRQEKKQVSKVHPS